MIQWKQIFTPARMVLLSFLFTIFVGTLLLWLPFSRNTYVPLIDCFFTSTSATCNIGSLSLPFDAFSIWGKIIILILIQIGGIGIVTASLFLLSLFIKLGLATRVLAGQILEVESWKQIKNILIFIIAFTFITELIGSILIFFLLSTKYPASEAIFKAIFHCVSAFCNTNVDIFGHNFLDFKYNIPMLTITAVLILLGGIGFVTCRELFGYLINRSQAKPFRLSLTTKVILIATTISIIIMALLLIILEGPAQFSNDPWYITVINNIFGGISFRSSGFSTIDPYKMKHATIFAILVYSFIGSSPGSTGSGIKITTFSVFLATIRSVITGKTSVDLKKRKLPQDQIFKAMCILFLSISWIVISNFLILSFETKFSFIDIFFETVSTFTNIGLVTDITPQLSTLGKLLVAANMYIGRLGSLTFLLALKIQGERPEFQYPEERIMMG